MASSFYYILALLVLVPPCMAASSSACNHDHDEKPRSLHFTLFEHETVNKTVYAMVEGIGKPGTNSFGTFSVYEEPLTLTVDPSSKKMGVVEGTAASTNKAGIMNFAAFKVTLNLDCYKGSLAFVGTSNVIDRAEHAIVGGTGDFLFAQGIGTSYPVKLDPPALIYRIEFDIYWPPFAPSYAI